MILNASLVQAHSELQLINGQLKFHGIHFFVASSRHPRRHARLPGKDAGVSGVATSPFSLIHDHDMLNLLQKSSWGCPHAQNAIILARILIWHVRFSHDLLATSSRRCHARMLRGKLLPSNVSYTECTIIDPTLAQEVIQLPPSIHLSVHLFPL